MECDDATFFFYLPIDDVASILPDGFVPMDAAMLLGVPAPTGQGAIGVSSLECRGSTVQDGGMTGLFVLVEPPRLPELGIRRDCAEAYLAGLYVGGSLAQQLGSVGHDVHVARFDNTVPDPPQSGVLTASVEDDDGPLAALHGVVPRPVESPPNCTNSWQVTQEGLLHLGVVWAQPRDFAVGTGATCSIRTDSRIAVVLGFTDCTGQKSQAFAAVNDAYEMTWNFFPGIQPDP